MGSRERWGFGRKTVRSLVLCLKNTGSFQFILIGLKSRVLVLAVVAFAGIVVCDLCFIYTFLYIISILFNTVLCLDSNDLCGKFSLQT